MKLKPLRFTKMAEGHYVAHICGGLIAYYVDKEDGKWRMSVSPGSLFPKLSYFPKKLDAIHACQAHYHALIYDLFTIQEGE